MDNIAEKIIAGAPETDSDEEEFVSIDEEFRGLYAEASEMQETINKMAGKSTGETAAIYRVIAGDVMSLIKTLISATGAGLEDAMEVEDEEDEEAEEGEGGEFSEETLQIYSAVLANIEAFQNLANVEGIPEASKAGALQMVQLNNIVKGNLDKEFGPALQEKAIEYTKKVS